MPDWLNLARVVLAALFAVSVVVGCSLAVQLGLLLAAAVTDLCDGPVARRMGVADQFGAFLDTLADKGSLLLIFSSLCWVGAVPLTLTVTILVREGLVLVGRVRAHRTGFSVRHSGGLLNVWVMFIYSLRALTWHPGPTMDGWAWAVVASSVLTGAWTLRLICK
ncbi:MAG: CDP-alcohol phosphatidyltransferase family protein [Patescibacteria group bacterium]